MIDSWLKWGTFGIAVGAFLQPWVIRLFHKLFPGAVDIYETGTIEIGYSGLGATVGLHGTLRGRGGDFFISSGQVEVEKLSDHSQHHFQWGVFRAVRGSVANLRDFLVELPAGFMLLQGQPHRFNIQFHDNQRQQEIQAVLRPLRGEWMNLRGKALAGLTNPNEIAARIQKFNLESYAQFSASRVHMETFRALDRLCYWEAGDYRLTTTFLTSRPTKQFSKLWYFTLTTADIEGLNTIKLLCDVCDQNLGEYFFAYPQYKNEFPIQVRAAVARN